ncbi:hypothetical protein [Corallococcus sp. CA053C]|uniref:hypothetical protein n=1 Tax=Corallococcus sp. CA053C TaxID=2316732 RepID=UPI001F33108B|nr:hypothetical protein [Corallococcus sp. CA053C]
MSEYQCYEFIALDRPLTPKQMAELRGISTRAEISPTRFWNEYQWGDLKADPAKLLARYFDAHLYFANWGTHRLMLRLPRARVDVKALKGYFTGRHAARLTLASEHVVLDFSSQDEEPEDDEEREGSLAALSPLRAELLRGDLRSAYLAWLLAVQAGDVGDEAPEPPVPEGLATLTAAQQAMVEFLRIDVDLLAAAARDSAEPDKGDDAFRRWVTRLPPARKDQWLLRAVDDPDLALGGELLRTFRAEKGPGAAAARRTVRELQALAETQQGMRVTVRPTTCREGLPGARCAADAGGHVEAGGEAGVGARRGSVRGQRADAAGVRVGARREAEHVAVVGVPQAAV